MTPDPSPPPLTEEELAAMDREVQGSVTPNDWTLARLITDLRASRERIKELEAELTTATGVIGNLVWKAVND